jgi:hypothetical protein
MGFDFGMGMQGAVQGGMASGNPFGALAGGLISGFMGQDDPASVDDILPRIDATAQTNKVMGQSNMFNRQMSGIQGSASSLGDQTTQKLIAAGIDPTFAAQTGAQAQYKALTSGTEQVSNNASAQHSSLLNQWLQTASQRDDDRASYRAHLDNRLTPKRAMQVNTLGLLSSPKGMKGLGEAFGLGGGGFLGALQNLFGNDMADTETDRASNVGGGFQWPGM